MYTITRLMTADDVFASRFHAIWTATKGSGEGKSTLCFVGQTVFDDDSSFSEAYLSATSLALDISDKSDKESTLTDELELEVASHVETRLRALVDSGDLELETLLEKIPANEFARRAEDF
jgi:hypothetical protein